MGNPGADALCVLTWSQKPVMQNVAHVRLTVIQLPYSQRSLELFVDIFGGFISTEINICSARISHVTFITCVLERIGFLHSFSHKNNDNNNVFKAYPIQYCLNTFEFFPFMKNVDTLLPPASHKGFVPNYWRMCINSTPHVNI